MIELAKVRLDRVSKTYGTLEAVKDFSLEVKDGEFLCMLGPSGCGKTTTLRMIAGLERSTSGDIYIGENRVNDLSPGERDVAMVFQFYAIYPGMTVLKNLAFPLESKGISEEEIRKRVKETAESLRIDHLLDKVAMGLTVGEKQRVALGRAFIRRPSVYLLDEPLTNLDARLRAVMRAELKHLQKDIGITTIYVTHDQLEGITMADRIAVMNLGRLRQLGTPDEIYNRPKDHFCASFVGDLTMNFIDCSLVDKESEVYLDAGAFIVDASRFRELIKTGATSSELVLGVRPEDISVHKKKVSDEHIEAKVDVMEPLGDQLVVDFAVGSYSLSALLPPSFEGKVGEAFWISFDMDRIHIFDKKTETTIV